MHPDYGEEDNHDVCKEEAKRRADEKLCERCCLELVYPNDIRWGTHDGKNGMKNCYGDQYVGYKAPDQKIKISVGYYNESKFKKQKAPSYSELKEDEVIVNGRVTEDETAEEIEKVEIRPVNYEHVGGMDKEIKLLREHVEFPLMHPEMFIEAGIDIPKGVLLHGPSGTGKTLIAKTMSEQIGINFVYIAATSLQSQWVGETEGNIRKIFKNAINNAPSIIFMDEIDAMGKNRDNIDRNYQADITMQLLSSIDDIKDEQVMFIGATNYPDKIDPALRPTRKAGRRDRDRNAR